MSGVWDAEIVSLAAAEPGSTFTVEGIAKGAAFDVLAGVEVGENLHQVTHSHTLFVAVRNLSASTTVSAQQQSAPLKAAKGRHQETVVVPVAKGWKASEGDVLEVVASYKVEAGINTDYSIERSQLFVVTA